MTAYGVAGNIGTVWGWVLTFKPPAALTLGTHRVGACLELSAGLQALEKLEVCYRSRELIPLLSRT